MLAKIKKFFRHPEIQIALALGFSIIVLAYVSKRILHIEIRATYSAIPGMIAVLFETAHLGKLGKKFARPIYWIVAILLSTLIIILAHVKW
jgi:hypothetical protein